MKQELMSVFFLITAKIPDYGVWAARQVRTSAGSGYKYQPGGKKVGKVTGIAHIAITAKDMDKSLDFYTRVLGFKKSFEIRNPETGAPWINYLYIGNGQFAELFYNGSKDNPWVEELRGFSHVSLLVDDIHSVVEMIKKEGGVVTGGPMQGCDNNWQAWITDPDGVRIELMQIVEDSPQYKAVQEG